MALNYEQLMGLKREGDRFRYTDRETMLYAIGIGMGRDPLDAEELAYVFEQGGLKTVPTMASVLARVPLLKDCGYDYAKVLHGEQKLALHRTLPAEGELIADSRVTAAYDKGAGKGAVILTETEVRLAADDKALFTQSSTTFACRAVLKAVAGYDHTRIRGFDVRFSAPVYPGESITTDLWIDGNTVSFRCRVPEREVVVINNGKCVLA